MRGQRVAMVFDLAFEARLAEGLKSAAMGASFRPGSEAMLEGLAQGFAEPHLVNVGPNARPMLARPVWTDTRHGIGLYFVIEGEGYFGRAPDRDAEAVEALGVPSSYLRSLPRGALDHRLG